jgi:phage terminase large subunit GpA-like protein
MKFERRSDGQAKRSQKRAFMLNVSQLKADFYAWLKKDDPLDRGFVHIARGMGDEYYRQITSEVRVLRRNRAGVTTSAWELAEPGRRNEGLDTMLYAEAAARRKGWTSLTEAQWEQLEAERGAAPAEPQGDLFDGQIAVIDTAGGEDPAPKAKDKPKPSQGDDWIKPRKDWL